MTKRALLVGIDKYQRFRNLKGCSNDVAALAPLFARNDDEAKSKNFTVRKLVNAESITRDRLLSEVERNFAGSPEVALFYFAGHGNSRSDDDVKLCTYDGTKISPGVHMAEVMTIIGKSRAREKIVVLDCCFSGGSGGVPQIGSGSAAFLPDDTTILAASGPDEVSRETLGGRGLFTSQLCEALHGGAADVRGHVTSASVYAYVDKAFGAFEQRPMLRANLQRLQLLRTTMPRVSDPQLREVAEMFADVNVHYALDCSYEQKVEPRHPENERKFKLLQDARDGGLVEVVPPHRHFYFAALGELEDGTPAPGFVRLTPLGKHYMRQVIRGHV